VADVSPIAQLTELEYLDLDANNISDLTPLSSLEKLTTLYLSFNLISDVSSLTKLTALETLVLWGNRVVDVRPLAGLRGLAHLDLGENDIADISPLASLTGLQSLYLSYNSFQDLSPLTSLQALNELALAGNGIRDIAPLAALAGREFCLLDLSRNSVTDIGTLRGLVMGVCESGALLDLSFNQIKDLSPLADLQGTAGDSLDVRGNPLGLPDSPRQTAVIAGLRERGISILDTLPLAAGALAPPFALQQLGSDITITLDALRGEIVVLDFWASWCGPCRVSMPILDALVAKYPDDVVLVGVNLDRRESDAVDCLEEIPTPHMRVAWGSYAEAVAVSNAYGDMLSNGIPHTFVVDREGVIRFSGHPNELSEDILLGIVRQ
jgi:thiol-disulfide isomerase/thioredoxin